MAPVVAASPARRGLARSVARLATPRSGALLAALVWAAACAPNRALWDPTPEMLSAQAPDSFVVLVQTSEGPFEVTMHREWSPLAVDRVYQLMSHDFYAGARFYRVVPGFVAQWGFSGKPALDSAWEGRGIPDEPVVESNVRGIVSFARAGPESRNFTLFVNLADNSRLDELPAGGVVGYPPIGRVTEGVDVIDGFYPGYTMDPPYQDSIEALGNEYLRRRYPQLDSIVSTRVVRAWP